MVNHSLESKQLSMWSQITSLFLRCLRDLIEISNNCVILLVFEWKIVNTVLLVICVLYHILIFLSKNICWVYFLFFIFYFACGTFILYRNENLSFYVLTLVIYYTYFPAQDIYIERDAHTHTPNVHYIFITLFYEETTFVDFV